MTRIDIALLARTYRIEYFDEYNYRLFPNYSGNCSLDAWFGMQQWARMVSDLTNVSTTRQDYEEKGGEYFKEHQLSNHYIPTPVIL